MLRSTKTTFENWPNQDCPLTPTNRWHYKIKRVSLNHDKHNHRLFTHENRRWGFSSTMLLSMNRILHRFVPSYKCRDKCRKRKFRSLFPFRHRSNTWFPLQSRNCMCVCAERVVGAGMDAFDQSFHRQLGSAFDQSFQYHLLRKIATEREMLHHPQPFGKVTAK